MSLGDLIVNIINYQTAINSYIGRAYTQLFRRLTCHFFKFNAIQLHSDQHITKMNSTMNIKYVLLDKTKIYTGLIRKKD